MCTINIKKQKHKFSALSSSELSAIISEWILDEKHRLICHLKFVDGKTYEAIAEDTRVNLTDRQVRNIVRRCSDTIQEHIEDYVVGLGLQELLPQSNKKFGNVF